MELLVSIVLVALFICSANGQTDQDDFRLTAEREGPLPGAGFAPIPVVPFQKLKKRPTVPPPLPQPPTSTPSVRRTTTTAPSLSSFQTRPPQPPTRTPMSIRRTKRPQTSAPLLPVQEPLPSLQTQFVEVPIATTPRASPTKLKPKPKPDTTSFPEITTYRPKSKPVITTAEKKKPIVRLLFKVSRQDDNGYFFEFISEDSIHRMERGFFKKDPDSDELIHVKTGLYSFETPEGEDIRIDYIADEKGYRTFIPQSESVPVPEIELGANNNLV